MKNLIECPAERAIYFLGGKWKIRILFTLYNNKKVRFNILKRGLKTITQQMLSKQLKELETALQSVPVKLPAKDYYISSLYGYRKDPMSKRRSMHKGIDMAGWKGTKIFTPANGMVRRAGHNGSYGLFIEIDHQNGFLTRYGHLSKIKVHKGQTLTKDDLIGLMGSTGRSSGTHLHYEILFENKQINPLKLIKALKDVH